MAAHIVGVQSVGIRACATSDHRKQDAHRRSTSSPSSSANWWTPLFGWSSEPDYIDSSRGRKSDLAISDSKQSRSRIAPGSFTEEKARRFRMMTMESASFHDAMYHSAIANRMASDFKNRSDSSNY